MARMISRQDAAELLDCDPQTIKNWVDRGLLKGHVVGRALMIDRESIEQYFDDMKELTDMAQQIKDLKVEYHNIIRDLKEVLNEAKGTYIEPARARDAFKANQLALLSICEGYLGEREGSMFSALIRGEKADDVAKKFDLPRERIIQISINVANKISGIKELKDIHEQNKALKAENENLRQMISERDVELNNYKIKNKLASTVFDKRLEDFNLSVRTRNGLKCIDIKTIADLVKYDREHLLRTRFIGKKAVSEIEELLSSLGLHLDMNPSLLSDEELKKLTDQSAAT